MPKLSAFAPCNEILHDERDNASAIHVFNTRIVGDSSGKEIPRDAALPIEWAILTVWLITESELGKNYVQKCVIYLPDGNGFGGSELPFTTKTPSHTLKLSVPLLPVGMPGEFTIRVWLEEDGKKVTDEYAFPFLLLHLPKKENAEGA